MNAPIKAWDKTPKLTADFVLHSMRQMLQTGRRSGGSALILYECCGPQLHSRDE